MQLSAFGGASRSSPFAQIHLLLLHDPESFWHMIVGGYTYPDDNKVELFNWLTGRWTVPVIKPAINAVSMSFAAA